MSRVELPGLLVRHPGAALAAFGLYSIFPEAKISFQSNRLSYSPVLHGASVTSVKELAKCLVDPATWNRLNMPPDRKVCDTNTQTQLIHRYYKALYTLDPDLALGLGTDLMVVKPDEKASGGSKKKEARSKKLLEDSVKKSPFYHLSRNQTFGDSVEKVLALLKVEEVEAVLTDPTAWTYHLGCNFGFFPEDQAVDVFKNRIEVSGKSPVRNIPIICLLGVASWRLFPVHLRYRHRVTPGFDSRCEYFYFPVFNVPHSREEFNTLLLQPLRHYAKYRQGWKRAGVVGVYKVAHLPLSKNNAGCFLYPESL